MVTWVRERITKVQNDLLLQWNSKSKQLLDRQYAALLLYCNNVVIYIIKTFRLCVILISTPSSLAMLGPLLSLFNQLAPEVSPFLPVRI